MDKQAFLNLPEQERNELIFNHIAGTQNAINDLTVTLGEWSNLVQRLTTQVNFLYKNPTRRKPHEPATDRSLLRSIKSRCKW